MTMAEHIRRRRLGAATITVINVGDLQVDLGEWIDVSQRTVPPHYAADFGKPLRLPIQCTHIELPGISVLVDAGDSDFTPGSPGAIPEYQPPPDLSSGLAEAGIAPDEITCVVITHGHLDHFNGTTGARNGQYVPRFPHARHYFSRADWEDAGLQKAMTDTNSTASRTLGLLHRQGLLELSEGNRDLGNGVRIIAAPGETPGHQIVRIHSEGFTLYCVGDLYHHPVEVEQAEWMVRWADTEANLTSRNTLAQAALAENALLVATHIPSIGCLKRMGSGVTWAEA
jgi:glyoxylase-like metal-dependent hydrolase (beta-lactamase superfamily II)